VGVLTVDIDQRFGALPQLGQRHGAAIDPRFGAACSIDHTAQQDTVIVLDVLLLQPFERHAGGVALHRNIGAAGACSHHDGLTLATQHQPQGVDQNRFAGTGFTGEHREARLEVEL
jgi:hypothetical protein